MNEDSFQDSRGNTSITYIPVQQTLVEDADMSAASAGIDDNDMAVSTIEKVNQPRVTWRDDIIPRGKKRKKNDKLQQIVNTEANAEFEFSVAETELENLSSSMEFDMPYHPMIWDSDYIEPPELPHPEGWEKPREVSAIDLVLDTYLVANPTGNVSTSKDVL